ncbi:hypothetical protein QQF64_033879 [Cirrhinus molitorella]|uniref:Uncharacterized protein n=1 Tax=Cirrhinus molitorella TaxID=172907 RepID=A0ABR3MV71_9TELE
MAVYVDDNHKKWDQFLPEFRFALNSSVQETTGLTPAELQLGWKLQGPVDKMLHGANLTPDAASYDMVHHLHQLQTQAKENSKKAKLRQLRNYKKNRRDLTFKNKDRIGVATTITVRHHMAELDRHDSKLRPLRPNRDLNPGRSD